jgi:hypothetical protein
VYGAPEHVGFLCDELYELSPSRVADGSREPTISDHACHIEVFDVGTALFPVG